MANQQQYLENLDRGLEIASAVEAPSQATDVNEVRLSTGVILGLRPIATRIIVQAMERFEAPKVPVVWDEAKQRNIENPQHPDYIQALEDHQVARGMAMYDACVALGTELKFIPEGFSKPDDPDWVDDLVAAGIEFDASRPRLRYIMWVKTVAALRTEDAEAIVRCVTRRAGVTQEDVSDALGNFRSET